MNEIQSLIESNEVEERQRKEYKTNQNLVKEKSPAIIITAIPKKPFGISNYDSDVGLNFHLDYIARINRDSCTKVQIVYAVFRKDEMI